MENFSAYAALRHLQSDYTSFYDVMEAPYAEPGLMTREPEPMVDWMAGETALTELMYRGVCTFLTRDSIFMAPPLIIEEKELMQSLGPIDDVSSIADKAVE